MFLIWIAVLFVIGCFLYFISSMSKATKTVEQTRRNIAAQQAQSQQKLATATTVATTLRDHALKRMSTGAVPALGDRAARDQWLDWLDKKLIAETGAPMTPDAREIMNHLTLDELKQFAHATT